MSTIFMVAIYVSRLGRFVGSGASQGKLRGPDVDKFN